MVATHGGSKMYNSVRGFATLCCCFQRNGLSKVFAAFILIVLAAGFSSLLISHRNLRIRELRSISLHDDPPKQAEPRITPFTTIRLPLCPETPPKLRGPLNVTFSNRTEEDILKFNDKVLPGGSFRPFDCIARNKTAIIIPFRERHEHLRALLDYLHPILQRQQLDYAIFVVEQFGSGSFNKGRLMNSAFVELKKFGHDCFLFHDVDLFPEDDRNIYTCRSSPAHFAVLIDKFGYQPIYGHHFGGVVALTDQQHTKINGWPNAFWGWGGEDDDMGFRVGVHGYKIWRPSRELSKYKMIKHGSDRSNPVNSGRFNLLGNFARRFATDGLSNLKYTLKETQVRGLYTWLLVDVGTMGDDVIPVLKPLPTVTTSRRAWTSF